MTPEPVTTQNALLHSAILRRDLPAPLIILLSVVYGNGNTQTWGPYPATAQLIHRLLVLTDSTEWSEVAGKPIRVRGTFADIKALGHFLLDAWIVIDPTTQELS